MSTVRSPIRRAALGALIHVVPACATAQPVERIPDIVVTAARSPQSIEALIADVTVIDADEIARSGVQSLSELLQRQPGIEVVRNGGPGAVSGAFIRGANRTQTLLLVDGLRVASSSVGAPTLEALPLSAIDRIEILRGPASSLYGADAIGGVIQVFTRGGGGGFAGRIDAGYGTHDTRAASGGVSGSLGPLALALNAGKRRSDGFDATTPDAAFIHDPDRDGYDGDDLTANARLAIAPGHEFFAQLLRTRLDAQFDAGGGFDDRTKTTLQSWQLGSRNRFHSRWTSRLVAGETSDESVSSSAFGDSAFRTRQRQYAWHNDVDFGDAGKLVLSVERREERLTEDAGFAVTSRDTDAIVGVWQWVHDGHAVQANLRHDHSDQYGGETTGALAWGWRFAPAWRVTASYGTAFKAPSFNDLYFPGFSNPDLVPETARNVEAGLHWTGRAGEARIDARAVAWHNKVDELIVFQCDASFNCAPRNVDRATLTGVTLSADARWRDTQARLSIDLQDPEDDATGRLLPRRAKRHGAFVLTHAFGPVRVGLEVIASSHRFDDAENTRRLAGYGLVNVTAEWTVGRGVTLYARGDNLTDRDYALASGYRTGGAQVFAGLRWQP